jgi:uncharacterized protein (UPF0335 family)
MSNGVIAADQLRLFLERIERLQEEKKGIADDIRDVFSEAKSQGFDAKIMRKVIKLRAQSADDRAEEEALIATYCAAIGLTGTPLGDYYGEPEQKKAA